METQERYLPVSDRIDKYPIAKPALLRYTELWPDPTEQSRQVKQYMMQELAEGKEGNQLTANPAQPGNTEYVKHSPLNRESFLRERLKGRTIDIGSGGVNELAGIVPENNAVYVDNNPQQQLNFHQISVGEEALPFPNDSFDAVFSRNAIQGEEEAKAILPEALRVLKPDGRLVIELQYLPEGEKEAVLSTLAVLEELGIEVNYQCEATIDEAYIQHKRYPLRFNQPAILLTVNPNQQRE